MDKKTGIKNDIILHRIMNNIDYARMISLDNQSVKIVVVVSGNELDKLTWQNRLAKTGQDLFNRDGSTEIISLQEKVGKKRKEGNFLGTLLAYINLKEILQDNKKSYRDYVILMGMLFGRGERMSPFTQIEGDRKPSIIVSSQIIRRNKYLTAIEEALFYFVPVAKYLELRGFRGILDKWGDETEIASIDLSGKPVTGSEFSQYDVIKWVSYIRITEELAKEKDWVVSDGSDNVTAMLARNEKAILVSQLDRLGIKPVHNGDYYAGVSLGPIAVSYDVLDIAVEVFDNEIYKNGIHMDFDPYLVMALSINKKNLHLWEEAEINDKGLQALLSKIPDFFLKVQHIKKIFEERYNRKLRFKALDLGADIFWADIGQHYAMRQKYMSLNEKSRNGEISRKLESIMNKRDARGNIIINSRIDKGISIHDSIIINSTLTGKGKIEKSVIKNSTLNNPQMTGAFSVLSFRPAGITRLHHESGLYRSLGNKDLDLGQGMRHGTLITKSGVFDMMISESTDLRDRDHTYNVPIFDNEISFAEAYDEMFGVSEEELEERRNTLIKKLLLKE
ncbi:MAG: hypothetical protein JXB88_17150 [Spirochaetales bacterium]|nr:hypothetical protein [Spirochaetales bacterium]